MLHTQKPSDQSRAVLLGYLLGHVSGIDSTMSGNGLDEMRKAGVSAIRTQLQELRLSPHLDPFTLKTVDSNALALSDTLEERLGMTTVMFFCIGLSLALIPIRRRQGLPTRDSEQKLVTLSEKCEVQELITSLLSKFRSDSPDYDEAVVGAITEISRLTAPKVFISYSQGNSPIAVSIANHFEANGIGT